jgi:PncC family amidohydrolase
MDPKTLHALMLKSKLTLGLAESCTGGKVAASLTAIPGASNFLLGSIVAYSNDWKEKFLYVSPTTLRDKGAVSYEAVEEMVQGLLNQTNCDIAAAVSGIAGPTGGSAEKPVGTIFIATCRRGHTPKVLRVQAPSPRDAAINFAVETVLKAISDAIDQKI